MKKKNYGFGVLLITGLVLFWACKTSGTTTKVPPEAFGTQPQAPVWPVQDALDVAIARAG
jgi:hypothetical protein